MTFNVQGELLVAQENPLANQSPLPLNGTKTWIDVNSVHNKEVINSSAENNEHNQTSNKNEIIEEHKKNKLRRFI